MSMIREALDLLFKTGADAAGHKASIVNVPGVNRTVYVLTPTGELQVHDVDAPHRSSETATIASLLNAVERFANTTGSSPVIWHHEKGVVAELDTEWQDEWIHLPLSMTKQYLILRELEDDAIIQHKRLVRLLRYDFHECVSTAIVDKVKKISFRKGETADSDTSRGRDTLGKSVDAEVTNITDIPEEINLDIPIYETPELRDPRTIRCYLDIDPMDEVIRFAPFPGQLETAIRSCQNRLHELLDGGGCTVLHGYPKTLQT